LELFDLFLGHSAASSIRTVATFTSGASRREQGANPAHGVASDV
jgi:hypothetical protein